MRRIDLRSDTVAKPTAAMLDAMRNAELGDEGREGDPTVQRLEALAAEITGKEAALFVVSGTMGNTIALMASAGQRGTVLLHEQAHILRSELGALSTLAGLFHRPIAGDRGAMDLDFLRAAIRPSLTSNELPTVVIAMENTHNGAGGTVLTPDHMAAVHELAGEVGIPVHTDGARLFNAAVALGVPAREVARHSDTISFCLSKGLSAPVGSLIVGSAEVIDRAKGYRKMMGGTLRQAGGLAAAGIVALTEGVDRLAADHANARRLAQGLHNIDPTLADSSAVESNIVMVDLSRSGRVAADWAEKLNDRGLWTAGNPSRIMRLVTHREITAEDVEQAIKVFATVWDEFMAPA